MDAPAPAIEIEFALERVDQARAVDALVDRAFGPGRYAKAAERLREGNVLRRDLSFTAVGAGEVVGAIRQWPVMVGEHRGLFLGPIAVEGGWRKHGIGADLIARAVAAAEAADEAFILLVGDWPLFGPHGFEVVPTGQVILPGPVDPRRVFWRATRAGGLDGVAGAAHVPPRV
jgi:predicted N-acetyltransferase YhbS